MLFNGQIGFIKIPTLWSPPTPKQLIFMTGEIFLKHLKVRDTSLAHNTNQKN